MTPLAIDLFCGLGGWTEGLLAEGWKVIGFDIERHDYGTGGYPAQLVLQDVLTLHGRQFKDAHLIVASPPCQEYSYRAMPWKRAKALPPPDNSLFESCFRIQREACEAAARHIPMVVENVRGAQKWVGRARWNFGSYYLWGDVPALMPIIRKQTKNTGGSWFRIQDAKTQKPSNDPRDHHPINEGFKSSGLNWSNRSLRGQDFTRIAGNQANEWFKNIPHSPKGHWTNPQEANGIKHYGGSMLGVPYAQRAGNGTCRTGSKSNARKFASAAIAKIPFVLSRHIARVWKPKEL